MKLKAVLLHESGFNPTQTPMQVNSAFGIALTETGPVGQFCHDLIVLGLASGIPLQRERAQVVGMERLLGVNVLAQDGAAIRSTARERVDHIPILQRVGNPTTD